MHNKSRTSLWSESNTLEPQPKSAPFWSLTEYYTIIMECTVLACAAVICYTNLIAIQLVPR